MKKILTSILFGCFLLASVPTFSQNIQWSFYAESGVSKIPLFNELGQEVSLFNFLEEKSKLAFSWGYGCQVEAQLHQELYLITGFSFSVLNDKRYHSEELNFFDDPIGGISSLGSIERRTNIKASYISMPLSFKYKAKRFGFHAGLQGYYLIRADMTIDQFALGEELQLFFQDTKTTNPLELRKLDFGPIGGLSFDINKSWSLQTELYWGLRNIEPDTRFSNDLSRKNRRLTLGIFYHLNP